MYILQLIIVIVIMDIYNNKWINKLSFCNYFQQSTMATGLLGCRPAPRAILTTKDIFLG